MLVWNKTTTKENLIKAFFFMVKLILTNVKSNKLKSEFAFL